MVCACKLRLERSVSIVESPGRHTHSHRNSLYLFCLSPVRETPQTLQVSTSHAPFLYLCAYIQLSWLYALSILSLFPPPPSPHQHGLIVNFSKISCWPSFDLSTVQISLGFLCLEHKAPQNAGRRSRSSAQGQPGGDMGLPPSWCRADHDPTTRWHGYEDLHGSLYRHPQLLYCPETSWWIGIVYEQS